MLLFKGSLYFIVKSFCCDVYMDLFPIGWIFIQEASHLVSIYTYDYIYNGIVEITGMTKSQMLVMG